MTLGRLAQVDLTDEELRLLVTMLTVESQESKFPLSARTQRTRRLLDKLTAAGPDPSSNGPPLPPEKGARRRR